MFLPYFCTPLIKTVKELVAQLVEQYTFNVWVLGSSPSQFTKGVHLMNSFFYLFHTKFVFLHQHNSLIFAYNLFV